MFQFSFFFFFLASGLSHPLADVELLQDEPEPLELAELTETGNENENVSLKTLEHQQSASVASEEDYDSYFLTSKPVDTTNSTNTTITSTNTTSIVTSTTSTSITTSTTTNTSNSSSIFNFGGRNNNASKFSFNTRTNLNFLSDEDIESLKFDAKLKIYRSELDNTSSSATITINTNTIANTNENTNSKPMKNDIILAAEQKAASQKQQTPQQQPLNAEQLLHREISATNANSTRSQFRVPAFFSNMNRK